jgi:hypothetical protein
MPVTTDAVSSTSAQGEVHNIMWYSLSVACGRSVVFSGSSTNKTDRHDITEILLKVALNTRKPNQDTVHRYII